MTKSDRITLLQGDVMDDNTQISLAELCRTTQLPAQDIIEYVAYGVIEPLGKEQSRWRFESLSLKRVQSAKRLQQDLGINTAGVALALDLLEEVAALRRRIKRLERQYPEDNK
jgi:hypothetical protein